MSKFRRTCYAKYVQLGQTGALVNVIRSCYKLKIFYSRKRHHLPGDYPPLERSMGNRDSLSLCKVTCRSQFLVCPQQTIVSARDERAIDRSFRGERAGQSFPNVSSLPRPLPWLSFAKKCTSTSKPQKKNRRERRHRELELRCAGNRQT